MDVLCLGLMVCDVAVKPVDAGIFSRDSARVDFVRMGSGGDAFNVAVDLARMGIPAGVAGKVGRDGFGRFLLEAAKESSVDTANVVVSGEAGTAACVVLVHPDGERSFAYHGGANDILCLQDVNLSAVGRAGWLHVGSAFELPGLDGPGLAEILKYAKARGTRTSLDVTGNPDARRLPALAEMLPYVDVFLPSGGEAVSISGESTVEAAAERFLGLGAGAVVVKDGSRGCFLRSAGLALRVPAFPVDAADTTGAGDAFAAGFLAAQVRGMGLEAGARLACAAGALCAAQPGTTAWARPFDEVVGWMIGQRLANNP